MASPTEGGPSLFFPSLPSFLPYFAGWYPRKPISLHFYYTTQAGRLPELFRGTKRAKTCPLLRKIIGVFRRSKGRVVNVSKSDRYIPHKVKCFAYYFEVEHS